jgi:hypothetical protein
MRSLKLLIVATSAFAALAIGLGAQARSPSPDFPELAQMVAGQG